MPSVEQLKSSRTVWTANENPHPKDKVYTFGQPALDLALQGGLSQQGLTLLRSFTGMGELTFLSPVIKQGLQKKAYIALINPPGIPNPDWFSDQFGAGDNVFYVKSDKADDHVWAFEQCIMSGVCAAVIAWDLKASTKQLRRCHIRAVQHQCLAVCVQSASIQHHAEQSKSPCSADLHLHCEQNQWYVDIVKQQGGWPKQNVPISHPQPLSNQAIAKALQVSDVLDAVNH